MLDLAKAPENLLKGSVVVEEKLNCFPTTFFLGKDKTACINAPKGISADVANYIRSIADRLAAGWTYFAGVPFGYPDKATHDLVLFDVSRPFGDERSGERSEYYVDWSHRNMIASSLEVDASPLIYEGKGGGVVSKTQLEIWRQNTPSRYGGGPVSGLIIKNYGEFGKDGRILMASLEGLCSF